MKFEASREAYFSTLRMFKAGFLLRIPRLSVICLTARISLPACMPSPTITILPEIWIIPTVLLTVFWMKPGLNGGWSFGYLAAMVDKKARSNA